MWEHFFRLHFWKGDINVCRRNIYRHLCFCINLLTQLSVLELAQIELHLVWYNLKGVWFKLIVVRFRQSVVWFKHKVVRFMQKVVWFKFKDVLLVLFVVQFELILDWHNRRVVVLIQKVVWFKLNADWFDHIIYKFRTPNWRSFDGKLK